MLARVRFALPQHEGDMNIKLQLPKVTELSPRITVIGIGGAGGNAVNNMIASGLTGVNFVVANTDAQALSASSAEHRIQLGINLTEGLGAGSKPEIGEAAAEEALDEIRSQISGSHMVFIAAGMGGGTGTGAASVVARVAKDLQILTVGVVTKPFQFEGARRMRTAEAGVAELRKHVDTLIVIPNQNLFRVANEKTTFSEAFVMADQILYSGIACIVDLIVKEGLINLDFADVRTIMSGMGTAMMGTGEATGDRRAIRAAEEAISNPLLDEVSLRGAKGLLLSILGGSSLTLYEVDEAASRVRQEVDPEANIIVGATFDESLGDRVRVSIVASGLSEASQARVPSQAQPWRPATPAQPRPSLAPAGPGVPAGREAKPPADEFMRALSKAIEPPPAPPEKTGKSREAWRGPGNVVIEEGLPPLRTAASGQIPSRGDQAEAKREAEGFTPAAPVEVRRSGRRLPEVEDFPPVGQREYHARLGNEIAPPPPHTQEDADDPPRKPGLLRRLTGFGLRSDAPPPHHPANHVPWGESDGRTTGFRGAARVAPIEESEVVVSKRSVDPEFSAKYQRNK
jgi:cell division protein FtsZ